VCFGAQAPGKCFRLFTEESFDELAEDTVPEIRRCALCLSPVRVVSAQWCSHV